VLGAWIEARGWEQVINRRSTTWKALPAEEREVMDAAAARRAALAAPTLIKRPVLVTGDTVEFGFKPARYAQLTG
jgi:arsenate reductase